MTFEGALFSLFQQPKEGQINVRTLPFKNSTARQFARSSRARPEVFRRARPASPEQSVLARQNLDGLRLRLFLLRKGQRQHTVLVFRRSLLGINGAGQGKG